MGEGRFWGEWLGDETTNEGNIRLQSWGAPPKLSISYKLEYQYCPEKERDSLIPGHIQSFQILTCDWHLENFVAPVTGIAVYSPPFPLSPPEINWFEDPFEKFSPMMLIEVLSTTLPHYHWSFQNIHRDTVFIICTFVGKTKNSEGIFIPHICHFFRCASISTS